MTTLPPSSSESAAFGLLHETVRRWIWQQNWSALRDIQEQAVPVLLAGRQDVLIGAATASGKTEAAFLPIVSAIIGDETPGFKVLYLSPLKALINDQFRRLEGLCEMADIPVVRWHGDVAAESKRRARKNPQGIVLITPESLEALFVRRGSEIARLFGDLRAVVIDELHAFIGSERGMQLQSLLTRLEVVTQRSVPRVGLSATLGDMSLAADCLRPGGGDAVAILQSASEGQELQVQVRGYISLRKASQDEGGSSAQHDIAQHLFRTLRGKHNLVFAGPRRDVESYADILRTLSEEASLPNEFFPHHGNLSKELRESVEARLKEDAIPTTALCTTTLELGIDIGEVESVASLRAPSSVAALRQRLGRSGRRAGQPAILRIYVEEREVDARTHPLGTLRLETVQSTAAVRLLVSGWCEPPAPTQLHLSTLVHQVLAVITQYGGIAPAKAFDILCRRGPFRLVEQALFAQLLRCLGGNDNQLIEQSPDGLLMLGEKGERLVEHYGFYAVFQTAEEYRVVSAGKTLGTIPVDSPLAPEAMTVFAGRRWIVQAVHAAEKLLEVLPASGGVPPHFGGGEGGPLHDRLVAEMHQVYRQTAQPVFLDANGKTLLEEGRAAFLRLGLGQSNIVAMGEKTLLFPWVGSIKRDTLFLALTVLGLRAQIHGPAVEVDAPHDDMRDVLEAMAKIDPPDAMTLARAVKTKAVEKFDLVLGEELLCRAWAGGRIDAASVPVVARALLQNKAD